MIQNIWINDVKRESGSFFEIYIQLSPDTKSPDMKPAVQNFLQNARSPHCVKASYHMNGDVVLKFDSGYAERLSDTEVILMISPEENSAFAKVCDLSHYSKNCGTLKFSQVAYKPCFSESQVKFFTNASSNDLLTRYAGPTIMHIGDTTFGATSQGATSSQDGIIADQCKTIELLQAALVKQSEALAERSETIKRYQDCILLLKEEAATAIQNVEEKYEALKVENEALNVKYEALLSSAHDATVPHVGDGGGAFLIPFDGQ